MKKETSATFGLLLATLFWGMTFSFIKDAVETVSPFNFLFWRFGLASFILLVIFFNKINFFNIKWIIQGAILGLFLGGTVVFQTIGLRYTSASTASFITAFSVPLVAVISSLLSKRWPSINVILAVLLAIGGIGLITLTSGFDINIGDVWILLCAIAFAIYIIFAGIFSEKGAILTLTFMQLFTITLMAALLDFGMNGFSIPLYLNVWISIVFCAVFASVIGFTLQLQCQRYVTPTKTSIIFSTEPIFATLTAMIYLGESINLQFVIGAGLIFLAIILSEFKLRKKVIPQE